MFSLNYGPINIQEHNIKNLTHAFLLNINLLSKCFHPNCVWLISFCTQSVLNPHHVQIKIVKNGYLCSIFALRFPELPRSILQCSGTGQPQQPVAGDRICKLLSVTLWCAAEWESVAARDGPTQFSISIHHT